ncbi:class II lanthipeptide, LchA2/BrtA2 family [Butyrivibrio sp. VCD2006]|uniref:class II lanthipeptide, LchA2/BrtA2 family n=1 Tax=Butyrivibrio sp. VCD2006 TaxID=1280664 RepID=UPI00041F1D3A|nr:class II lanthipeptide, LchA2/BrtA2 family [Butyrivibrio sp. VCD2006]
MGEFNNEIKNAPEGEVNEQELKELTNAEQAGGVAPVVPIIIAASTAFCPTIKCTSKC